MALTNARNLRFNVEWEAADGVRAPELRATWARFELRVGDDVVTQVHDALATSVRQSIYVPLYPLAEWIAFNWWYLRANTRPSHLPHWDWSFRSHLRLPSHRASWLNHHNLRSVGDGFAWPDLTIVPGADTTHLAWQSDRTYPQGWRIRFLTSGHAELARQTVEAEITALVEAVLTRLDDQGVKGTPLQQEWRALQAIEADEARFCAAAARLGLDPFAVSDSLAELIESLGQTLEGPLLDDFLDAADPDRLDVDMDWISDASERVQSNDDQRDPIPTLGHRPAPPLDRPWELGLADARWMRAKLGIGPSESVNPNSWVARETVPRADRALLGLGGLSERNALVVALADSRSTEARRFAEARGMWRHARSVSTDGRFMLTSARTPVQQAERAFAAEFLAPADGIRDFLSDDDETEPVDLDDIAAASDHFAVNESVIEYQIINSLGREVDDPYLTRS